MNKAFEKILEKLTDVGGCDADCAYDKGGTFYAGNDLSLVSQNLFVNAWMELPEPYKGE